MSHHVSTNQDKDAEKDVDVAAWQSDIAFETWRCERLEELTFKIVQREPLQRNKDEETRRLVISAGFPQVLLLYVLVLLQLKLVLRSTFGLQTSFLVG